MNVSNCRCYYLYLIETDLNHLLSTMLYLFIFFHCAQTELDDISRHDRTSLIVNCVLLYFFLI